MYWADIPSNRNVRKKEYDKIEKYQGLKEELEKIWKMKTKVTLVNRSICTVNPKLKNWEISIQNSVLLRTHDTTQNSQSSRPLVEDLRLKILTGILYAYNIYLFQSISQSTYSFLNLIILNVCVMKPKFCGYISFQNLNSYFRFYLPFFVNIFLKSAI